MAQWLSSPPNERHHTGLKFRVFFKSAELPCLLCIPLSCMLHRPNSCHPPPSFLPSFPPSLHPSPNLISLVRDSLKETDGKGAFKRVDSVFRNFIEEGGDFPPESGRYHLYVANACPWANRCHMILTMKGLEDAISVSVVHPVVSDTPFRPSKLLSRGPKIAVTLLHSAKRLSAMILARHSAHPLIQCSRYPHVGTPIDDDTETGAIAHGRKLEVQNSQGA